MTPLPGTYTLVMFAARGHLIQVGRLGRLPLERGYYAYVGSAFGPGGIKARVRHHLRTAASPHWHIDYLRPFVDMRAVWYSTDTCPREHCWASIFQGMPDIGTPRPGFGASDCGCASHLFFSGRSPSVGRFRTRLYAAHPGHAPVLRAGAIDGF